MSDEIKVNNTFAAPLWLCSLGVLLFICSAVLIHWFPDASITKYAVLGSVFCFMFGIMTLLVNGFIDLISD